MDLLTARVDIWFHRYENGRDIEGRFDYNSWVESDKGRKLAATLNKDIVLAEGYKEYDTGRTYMARMGDWRNNKDEEIELDGIGGVNILVKADVHRSGKFGVVSLILVVHADCDQASTSPPTHSRIKPRPRASRRWLRERGTKSSDCRTMSSGISTQRRSQGTLKESCVTLCVHKTCGPVLCIRTSTIGRLEFCTSASAAKGKIEQADHQKMLVIHNTFRAFLDTGDTTGVWRPPGTRNSPRSWYGYRDLRCLDERQET